MSDLYTSHPMHDGMVEWDDEVDGDDFEPIQGWESVIADRHEADRPLAADDPFGVW